MNSLRYMVLDINGIVTPTGGTIVVNTTHSMESLNAMGLTADAVAGLIAANRLSDLTPLEPPPLLPPAA